MINQIKKELYINNFKKIKITINNVRNRQEYVVGSIAEMYERIFVVNCTDGIKRSFNYSDILTGNIELEYM